MMGGVIMIYKSIVGVWLTPDPENPLCDGVLVTVNRLIGPGEDLCSKCVDEGFNHPYWKCFLYTFSSIPDKRFCPSHARQIITDAWLKVRPGEN